MTGERMADCNVLVIFDSFGEEPIKLYFFQNGECPEYVLDCNGYFWGEVNCNDDVDAKLEKCLHLLKENQEQVLDTKHFIHSLGEVKIVITGYVP